LAIDPQRANTLYAGTDFNGAFKSTDKGKTWSQASSGIHLQYAAASIVALAIDPQIPGNLYAGTGSNPDPKSGEDGCGYGEGGVFKTTDGGMDWIDAGLISCMSAVIVDPQIANTVYAATQYSGMVKSLDGGNSWTSINSGLPNSPPTGPFVSALAIDPHQSATLYASAGFTGRLFKSMDGGNNWSATPLSTGQAFISALTIDLQDSNTIYAVTSKSPDAGGSLLKSTDAGTSWQVLSPSATTTIYAVTVNPTNSAIVFAATDFGVIMSNDAGENWSSLAPTIGRALLLRLDPEQPDTLYAGGPGGLFRIAISSKP
jgi:photosystem II stability/assembly factor-like uncharacterized protein